MSKHLRFGKLLSLLAILLTLSFAWSQAQNLSSQKQLLTFGFTTTANPSAQLGSDVWGTIDQTAHTVAITAPFQAVVTGLKASFTSSQFSNVYGGVIVPTPPAAVTGVSPTLNYTSPVTWTVEAENHSFEIYVVTVTKAPASGAKDITSLNAALLKPWVGNCAANGATSFTVAGAFTGTAVSLAVPFGTNLHAITVTYAVSAWASGVPATGSVVDFDANSDGIPEAVNFVVTAQNGTTQTYVVTPVVGQPSYLDNLLTFTIANSTSLTINNTNQTITATVPYSATSISPVWTISDYAKMYTAEPPVVPAVPATNICSGATYTLAGATTVLEFWIQGEKTTEISRYVLTVTKDAASTANSLTSISADYSKGATCQVTGSPQVYTGTLVGSIVGSTVTFNVPYNVTSLNVSAMVKSPLSTSSVAIGGAITNGSTITITSESGAANSYTVVLTPGLPSDNKQLLTFGFHRAVNPSAPWTTDYAGVIDPVLKHVVVTVAWNTDLYSLVAYFTQSDFACVSIAESNGTFTPQTTDVTLNDHSNTLTYVVTAENGTQERYDVIVNKAAALTGNSILSFSVNNLPYCTGLGGLSPFSVSGTITGNNITVMVPNRSTIDLTSLAYSLTLSPGATVTPNVTPANFSAPVTFTVTSQSGATNVYTVTVAKYNVTDNPASRKQLTKYWFDSSANTLSVSRADGTINEVAKTVEVWVPWGTNLTNLKASFELNGGLGNYTGGVVMTHSEDPQSIQTSGVTPNDFTTPVAYTVFAEDCSTVEYFVTVHMTPDSSTGISAFTFNVTPCATGCPLVNRIDSYARRIYITVPATVGITSLAPNSIVVAPAVNGMPAASVSPAVGVAQDWSAGPVKYTVTAPDGVTKADWMVYVTNPACQEHDILTFSLPDAQVSPSDLVGGHGTPVVIDAVNHKIDVIIKAGVNLAHVAYTRTLSCGATVCCVGGNCQDNFYLDFSQGGCHTCVVTAEDQTVKQDWTICVHPIDVAPPTVTTWSVMAYNCTDSVAVQSNEGGRVFIINESALNKSVSPWVPSTYNLADWTGAASVSTSVAALVAAHLGNWATVADSMANKPVYVKTNGLYSGYYWAYSVDNAGRISCISSQRLYLDICEVPIADLCTLRAQTDVFLYNLTGTVTVTYFDTDASGANYFFAQDASCGILVKDTYLGLNNLITHNQIKRGSTITGLKGTIDYSGEMFVFRPVCCYEPTVTGQGVEVAPLEMSYDDFNVNDYGNCGNECMVVKITTPVMFTAPGTWAIDTKYAIRSVTGLGSNGGRFIKTYGLHTNYMGMAVPTVPVYIQGVRWDGEGDGPANSSNSWGFIFPRDVTTSTVPVSDISLVTGVNLVARPNPATVTGVLPGQCKSVTITIYNQGVNNATISALYLDDSPASDEFNLVTPPVIPFVIAPWTSQTVTVNFCPINAGSETTNLIVEFGVGKTLVIPINGTTPLIFAMPYLQEFRYSAGPPAVWETGDTMNNYTDFTGWLNATAATAVGGVQMAYYSNWVTPYGGFDGRRGLFMRPRGGSASAPYTQPVTVKTPGFTITGTDPVVSWVETGWWALSTTSTFHHIGACPDPRSLSISEDGVNWTVLRSVRADAMSQETDEVASYTNPTWDPVNVSLRNYIGKTVYFKFDLGLITGKYVYWCVDQFEVKERVTTPIISASPNPADFGGVQVDATGNVAFTVKNVGISVLKIKSVTVTGDAFTLNDTNTYPVEVTDGPGTWAYTVGNSASALNFTVDFKPTDIGVKTGKVTIVYGLYSDQVLEIPLTGEGLSCSTAAVAEKGRNYAPSQNTWFKYTADKFSLVTITSCDINQKLVTNEYAWDTFLYVYSDCNGTLIASNDDMEAACVYNRASSSVTTAMNGGETVYIFWPLSFPTALHAYEGFYFNINVSYPLDGDVCENAIPLTLPVVNKFGTTVGFNNDYNASPCSPFSNYAGGNDIMYTITLPYEGYLTASILGAYGSIHVLDVCPKVELEKFHCKAFVGGPNGGSFDKKIAAGTYFVMVDTWAPPQTVDFLLNMSFRGTGVDDNALNSKLTVYPNPTNGKFNVNISNPEATDMTLELVNISGQVVYRNEVKGAYSYNEEIDATSFAKGVYYLKVNDAKGVKIEKVVVQ